MKASPRCMAGGREVFGKDALALRKGDLAIALENGEAVVVELEEKHEEDFDGRGASGADGTRPGHGRPIVRSFTLTTSVNASPDNGLGRASADLLCAIA